MVEPRINIRGVVCDLDAVVRHFDSAPQARLEADLGLAPGAIARLAFDPDILAPAITGAVDDAIWRESIAAALSRTLDIDIARQAVTSWSSSPGRVDPDVLGLLRRVRTATPVVALTNATSRLLDDLDALGVRHDFDAIVSSAATGTPKPEAGAFQAAQIAVGELLGSPVAAGDLLFIDDDAGYVDAAAQLGWNVVHFTDASSLARTLTECRLLD
jgi:putative hydrolase of the HAD superfamily